MYRAKYLDNNNYDINQWSGRKNNHYGVFDKPQPA